MKALVLEAINSFAYKDVPDPQIGPGDVLIRVQACGICGSDVHGMDGRSGRRIPPVIMGHEATGVIAEVGSGVRDWEIGDRVTFDSTIYCGSCFFCRQGKINLCNNRRVLGVSCQEYRQDGAFATYVAVPQRILYHLPDGLSFEEGTLVEALSIAVHAVSRTSIHLNDTAVVVGTGTIGLLVVQTLRAAGCGHIVVIDLDRGRLDLACKLGADSGFSPDDEQLFPHIQEHTKGRGADCAFEVVGAEPTLNLAVRCVRKGGSVTMVGNLAPAAGLPLQNVVTREINLIGTCASSGEYPACLGMIERGSVNVNALISQVAPLAEGGYWFKKLYDREPDLLKVVLNP